MILNTLNLKCDIFLLLSVLLEKLNFVNPSILLHYSTKTCNTLISAMYYFWCELITAWKLDENLTFSLMHVFV